MLRSHATPATARLLLAPGCPHCPAVLEGLSRLIKEGVIGKLEVVNLAHHPEVGEEAGVRTVPWVRIGPWEFEGRLELAELRLWAELAAAGGGWGEYFRHLLEHRRPEWVAELVRERPVTLNDLVGLLASLETPLMVRIGGGAVLEELAGDPLLLEALPALLVLLDAEEPQTRADGCHYLGLVGSGQAAAPLRRMLDDPNPDVREIAAESLALLPGVER